MNKRIIPALAGAVVLAGVLAGCASGFESERSTGSLREETITISDGRTVHCVIYASGYRGGLSCDWEGAR